MKQNYKSQLDEPFSYVYVKTHSLVGKKFITKDFKIAWA